MIYELIAITILKKTYRKIYKLYKKTCTCHNYVSIMSHVSKSCHILLKLNVVMHMQTTQQIMSNK